MIELEPESRSDTAAVSIAAVSKVFGRGPGAVAALDRVSLDVAPGEFVCLLGASGCGKSTLLNLVAGLDQPSSGAITVRAKRTGLMFQEAALFPWLTVRGNVELALKLGGAGRDERRSRTDGLLSMVHLTEFAKKRPHELSGGMRQRVALARALAQDAEVLLMDEPFGALDAMTRDLLHEELETVWRETGKTVLFVTHNVREAVRLGDRVVLLASRPGRVAEIYPVDIPRPRRIDSPAVATLAATITDRLRQEVSGVTAPTTDLLTLEELFAEGGLRSPSRAARLWSSTWPKLVAFGLFVGVWQVIVWTGWKPEYVLPSPFTVFDALLHDWSDLSSSAWVTIQRAIVGFAIAIVVGGVIGIAVARSHVLRAGVGSMITGLQTMPSVAWYPLAIVLFGLNSKAILFVVILGAAPAIANGIIDGIDNVPPILLRAGRVLGARGLTSLRHIVIPAALPSVVSGMKQGWAFAWRSLMAGELITTLPGHIGLAQQLNASAQNADYVGVYEAMIVIFIIGVLVDAVFFGNIVRAIRRRYGLIDAAA